MDLQQFLLTTVIAMAIGGLLAFALWLYRAELLHLYHRLTFRSVLLKPYQPKNNTSDNNP